MAEFGFTEEQEMIRAEARRFARREVAPIVKDRRRMSPEEWEEAIQEPRRKMVEMGWTAFNFPEKYGGQSLDYVSFGAIGEELAREDADVTPCGIAQNPMAAIDLLHMSEEVQNEWFPELANLRKSHCHSWTEPGAGSDAAAIQTRAVRDGDDYIITGEKLPISFGMIAHVSTLSTKTDPDAGARGITQFWLPLDLPGVTRSPIHMMGLYHKHLSAIITMDEVRVPARYRIGEEGQGFYMIMGQFDWARPFVILVHLAHAQVSLEEAMDWAKQRHAFRRPISKYEGVSFMIAENYTMVEAARMMCYKALWLRDQGLPHAKEAAMSKWFGNEAAVRAIHDSMIILGHVGYSDEHPVQERLRYAMGHEIGGGTSHIQKLIIARELMGREGLPY